MRNSNDMKIRRASTTDDAAQIAKLLYLTDPYIYPFLCDDFSDATWVDFVRRALKCAHHVHFAENMLLATLGDKIVGLVCAYPVPSDRAFLLPVDEKVADKYVFVWEGYYKNARDHVESLYISNLCVDPSYRHMGIGAALLEKLLSEHSDETVTLDVLADNVSAIALYEKAGFEAKSRYNGFSGAAQVPVLCVSMEKKASIKP